MIEVDMLRPTADEMLSGLAAGQSLKNRVIMQAKAVEQLPAVAGEMLAGLRATPALRHRILVRAGHRQATLVPARRQAVRPEWARFTPAVCMAAVLALMIGLGVNYAGRLPGAQNTANEGIYTNAAGASNADDAPAYRSLFSGEGANPPLIGINGRYYRMLELPVSVPVALVGEFIANVDVLTNEPSSVNPVGVFSQVVSIGAELREVVGIDKWTAIAAEVNGSMRLFQRVGYAGNSLVSRESLSDTLNVGGQVAALELSGVGVISDEQKAGDLIETLFEFAAYSDSEILDSDQALTIYLKNGLSLQLKVQGELLGACGAWACPEFFAEFTKAAAEQ